MLTDKKKVFIGGTFQDEKPKAVVFSYNDKKTAWTYLANPAPTTCPNDPLCTAPMGLELKTKTLKQTSVQLPEEATKVRFSGEKKF